MADKKEFQLLTRDFPRKGRWLRACSPADSLAVAGENAAAFSGRGQGAWHGR